MRVLYHTKREKWNKISPVNLPEFPVFFAQYSPRQNEAGGGGDFTALSGFFLRSFHNLSPILICHFSQCFETAFPEEVQEGNLRPFGLG